MRMQWIRHSLFSAVVIAIALEQVTTAQEGNERSASESLIIGKTIVRLSASKDSIVPVIALQYVVKPMFPNCTADLAACRAYYIFEADSFPVGSLEFDARNNLVKASVDLLRGFQPHSEGEIGKTLIGAIATIIAEGHTCSLSASSSESVDLKNPTRVIPKFLDRQAIIECGRKRIRIISTQINDTDSMQILEEIGCPSEFVGGCQQ
jgi:hypothetical protein